MTSALLTHWVRTSLILSHAKMGFRCSIISSIKFLSKQCHGNGSDLKARVIPDLNARRRQSSQIHRPGSAACLSVETAARKGLLWSINWSCIIGFSSVDTRFIFHQRHCTAPFTCYQDLMRHASRPGSPKCLLEAHSHTSTGGTQMCRVGCTAHAANRSFWFWGQSHTLHFQNAKFPNGKIWTHL